MRIAVTRLEGLSGHDAGRMLLDRLYRMETGLPLPEIAVAAGGKPYFPHSPLHFSITHTNRHAFCVLAQCNVGIDAEELDRVLRPGLSRRILSASEQIRLAAAHDQQQALLALWVLKEASAKLSGEGLRGFPNQTDFSPEDPRVRQWDGCVYALLREDENEGVTFHAF